MGGSEALRGYLIQTIIGLLEALDDGIWETVTFEPKHESEAIDILWRGKQWVKAVQIKSCQNSFQAADVTRWATNLESKFQATEFELILVGNCSPKIAKLKKIGRVCVPIPKSLDIVGLIEQAAHRLACFIEQQEIEGISAKDCEFVVRGIATQLIEYSVARTVISRDKLNELICEWILMANPKARKSGKLRLVLPKDPLQSENPFLYFSSTLPFYGRRDEMRELDEFLTSEKVFSWWPWIGAGGVGKSRLALELCKKIGDFWDAGFLDINGNLKTFDEWLPNRRTLIVIDYVSMDAAMVGEVIFILQARQNLFDYSVRMLILERENYKFYESDLLLQYSSRKSNFVKNTQYDSPRVLVGLSVKDILRVLISYTHAKIGNQTRKSILKTLQVIDPDQRPLFALFVADAVSQGRNMRQWSRNSVLEFCIQRERAKFRKFNIDVKFEILFTLATMVGGIDLLGELDYFLNTNLKGFIPTKDEYLRFCGYLNQILFTQNSNNYFGIGSKVSAIQPDILGEFYVLEILRELPTPLRTALIQIAWSFRPKAMWSFIVHAINDGGADPIINDLVLFDMNSPSDRLYFSMLIFKLICNSYGDYEQLLFATELFYKLEFVLKKFSHEPALRIEYVKSAWQLWRYYWDCAQWKICESLTNCYPVDEFYSLKNFINVHASELIQQYNEMLNKIPDENNVRYRLISTTWDLAVSTTEINTKIELLESVKDLNSQLPVVSTGNKISKLSFGGEGCYEIYVIEAHLAMAYRKNGELEKAISAVEKAYKRILYVCSDGLEGFDESSVSGDFLVSFLQFDVNNNFYYFAVVVIYDVCQELLADDRKGEAELLFEKASSLLIWLGRGDESTVLERELFNR